MNEANWNVLLDKIRTELSGLAEFIDETKNNIDSLENTVRLSSEKFPEASTQLSAVSGDLESAANNIMAILEVLLEESERSQKLLDELNTWAETLPGRNGERGLELVSELKTINATSKDSMMEILTSMSFHDLSGQKLKKVIGSLGTVEEKLLTMARKFGFTINAQKKEGDKAGAPAPLEQDLVDQLLKELSA